MTGQPALIDLLHAANQRADALWWNATKGAGLGLTPRQHLVLAAVAAMRSKDDDAMVSQTAIVERTGIDRSTLADVARRLSLRGLLVRKRSKDDARAYNVKLTAKGTAALNKAAPLAVTTSEKLLSRLSVSDQAKLAKMLAAIAEPDEVAQ